MPNLSQRPLEGFRVLDLTVALSGPYATLLLGGLGAEVIRVEAPGGSDISRTNPPFVSAHGIDFGENRLGEISLTSLNRARNKKNITLDLKSERGREILMALVSNSDVLVENMSEGTAVRLGIGYEHVCKVNPRIVYASIKAFGEPSAFPTLKGMDIIVQALSGAMDANGFSDGPPTRYGLPIADLLAPMYAVQGILAALLQRGRSGVGQKVSVSMLDCLVSWVAEEHFDVTTKQGEPTRSGNYLNRLTPFGVYSTLDGHVAIVAFQPGWLKELLDEIERPEFLVDPRFASRGPRTQNASLLNEAIEAWTSKCTSEEVVSALLTRRGVPCAKVRTPHEVMRDAHLHERGALTRLIHPRYGDVGAIGMGLPIEFSEANAQFDQPAQELGASNAAVYRDLLQLSDAEIASLHANGVI